MALTRFNGNVVPFASESTTDNRTVFGDVVQADDIDSNLNADFKKGWEIVGLNDNPTKQDFNAMGYTLGALTSYLYQMGIAEYNASQEYKLNAVCIGTDGTIYQSLVDANIGNALNDVSKWKNINNSFVDLVNNQSIDGIKTFVKSPIVPTPTIGTQAVNKDYADLKVALASFTGTNQMLAEKGYQKLPGGLIIQWGDVPILSNPTTWTFPIAFPNKCVAISGMTYWADGLSYANLSTNLHTSKTSVQLKNSIVGNVCFAMAIGY